MRCLFVNHQPGELDWVIGVRDAEMYHAVASTSSPETIHEHTDVAGGDALLANQHVGALAYLIPFR